MPLLYRFLPGTKYPIVVLKHFSSIITSSNPTSRTLVSLVGCCSCACHQQFSTDDHRSITTTNNTVHQAKLIDKLVTQSPMSHRASSSACHSRAGHVMAAAVKRSRTRANNNISVVREHQSNAGCNHSVLSCSSTTTVGSTYTISSRWSTRRLHLSSIGANIRSTCSTRGLHLASNSVNTGSTCSTRGLHVTNRSLYDDYENRPFIDQNDEERIGKRAWDAVTYEYRRFKARQKEAEYDVYRRKGMLGNVWREVFMHELLPYNVHYLIVGGGVIGSSIAYWVKQRVREEDLRVTVIERDDTFGQSSSILGVGGIRQQFSSPELIRMSQFGAEFLRHAGDHLKILDSDPPDIPFTPMGYLFLAKTEQDKAEMEKSHQTQLEHDVKVRLYTNEELKLQFPFMNFDDVILGSLGLENEGVFDCWSYLTALREKNLAMGVQYVKAEVTGFLFDNMEGAEAFEHMPEDEKWRYQRCIGALIKPHQSAAAPRPIRFMNCINAAGAWSGLVAKRARCGTGPDLLSIPVPVFRRKRYVFVFYCPDGPGLNMPFLVDPSGVWCRREGVGHIYHCGYEPTEEEDNAMDHTNLDLDEDFFFERIMPILVRRIPVFASLRYKNGWAAYYDMNTFDKVPIIGTHPVYRNFFQVCGFSGTGIQHSVAVGRAMMEQLLDGAFISINMRPFDMMRMMNQAKMRESIRV